MKPLAIGITAGDPNGIGPEVALKAALQPQPANRRLVLIGHRSVWARAAAQIGRRLPPEIPGLEPPLPRRATWDPDMAPPPAYRPGQVRADAARAAYAYILSAAAAAQNRRLDAIVTAPISKEAFHLAGIREPGHTDLLARLTDRGALLDAMGRLRAAYPNALAIERPVFAGDGSGRAAPDHRRLRVQDLFAGFHRDVTGLALDAPETAALERVLEGLEREARAR